MRAALSVHNRVLTENNSEECFNQYSILTIKIVSMALLLGQYCNYAAKTRIN